MKYFKISIVFTIILSIVIFSCDKIDPPYIIPLPPPPVDCPVPDFPDISEYKQVVLLEEFTAFKCVGCPLGTKIANELKEIHKDDLILVAIHSGTLAMPDPDEPGFEIDLRTPTGDELYDYFEPGFQPSAMLNRTKVGDYVPLYQSFWPGGIDTMLLSTPVIGMQMITDYDDADRKLCIHIQNKYLKDLSNSLMLSVFITEDSIITDQKNSYEEAGTVPIIYDYEHKHVLREAVNTPWGIELEGPFLENSTIITSYQDTLNKDYHPEHCHVVAFVYDKESKRVLQAVETKVIGVE